MIGIIGDERTVTGFRLGGVKHYFVVDETTG